jgi:hypothetical protein
LTHTAPKDAAERDYLRAFAEVAMAGGHWVVPAAAVARWPSIAAYARFFEEHAEWRRFEPYGALGIVQDSAGKETLMSGENLNLIARRGIPYRVIERSELNAAAVAALKVLLATDLAQPTEVERKTLRAFAQRGELIEGEHDPEALSKDMIEIVGYENVGVRVYNAPSVMSYLARAVGGRRLVLHLINYATAPAEEIKVQVKGNFSRANLLRPDAGSVDLTVDRAGGRTTASLPRIAVYAAVVWEE